MPTTLSIQSAILAVVMVIACLTCIWMVFFFGRRLQTSAYMRTFLLDSVKRQEIESLLRQLHDRAATGPLDPNSPPQNLAILGSYGKMENVCPMKIDLEINARL